jgi:predicted acyltransferase
MVSLDAFRGGVMLLMASSGLGLASLAEEFGDRPAWRFVGSQVEHAPWVGCTLWDLIQPAFMFMVGVALPFSIANRKARGQGSGPMLAHALWRAAVLVLLAVFLTSSWSDRTVWVFTNVLAQIGLGYPFLFLLAFAGPRTQWLAAAGILFGYWLAFATYPLPGSGTDWAALGIAEDWPHLTGFAAHWEKNANAASAFDLWFLNLFPREEPFRYSEGGYQTLNFVPSLATMIFGMQAGRLIRRDLPLTSKLGRLVAAGTLGLLIGLTLQATGSCPIIKRIWTPSWAIFSAGAVTLLLAGFVAVIEWRGWKRWAFPLVVAGMNPIALYCMWQLSGGYVRNNLERHLGPEVFEAFGSTYATTLERASVLLVFWLVLLWMYRRKIFLRI